MKLRFTNVTVKDVSDQIVGMPMTVYMGISADYEATDSDGEGNIGIDSGGLAPSDSYQPMYTGGVAQVEALTQQQIYSDFRPAEMIEVVVGYEFDSDTKEITPVTEEESAEEAWLADLQESLDFAIEVVQETVSPKMESTNNITDQTPINL